MGKGPKVNHFGWSETLNDRFKLYEISARCDEVRGSRGSRYVGRGRRATWVGASEPPSHHSH